MNMVTPLMLTKGRGSSRIKGKLAKTLAPLNAAATTQVGFKAITGTLNIKLD
jgi:hypothetical protein